MTVNYGVKQSQFTKPTSEPRASDPEESNEAFDARLEDDYCSITITNHRLITVDSSRKVTPIPKNILQIDFIWSFMRRLEEAR